MAWVLPVTVESIRATADTPESRKVTGFPAVWPFSSLTPTPHPTETKLRYKNKISEMANRDQTCEIIADNGCAEYICACVGDSGMHCMNVVF